MNHTDVICILGMHRSGTSCLAGAIEAGGLFLGEVVQLAPHNLKGNRENLPIRQLNDDVLAFSGGSWDAPPKIIEWNDDLRARREVILRDFDRMKVPWGFKDPRTVLTLPFWREAFIPRLVGTFRHPIAVAASLSARNRWPTEKGLDLWLTYNKTILREWERLQFPLIRFDQPPSAYVSLLTPLLLSLGLNQSGVEFFDHSLVHQLASETETHMLPESVRTTWEDLNARAFTALRSA